MPYRTVAQLTPHKVELDGHESTAADALQLAQIEFNVYNYYINTKCKSDIVTRLITVEKM